MAHERTCQGWHVSQYVIHNKSPSAHFQKKKQSVPKCLCSTFGPFSIKKPPHSWERSLIGKLQGKLFKMFSFTYVLLFHFSIVKIHRKRNKFVEKINKWECWHLFSMQKSSKNCSMQSSMFVAIQDPRIYHNFSLVLKPVKLKGAF